MVEEFKFGKMVAYMKDNGRMTKQMEKVDLFIKMEMFTLEIGKMIKLVVKEFILIQMAHSTMETGLTTNSTGMGRRSGQMELSTLVTTLKGRNMERVISNGLMGPIIMETLKTTTFMVKEYTNGQMVDDLKEIG
jgi:hypothetical protein